MAGRKGKRAALLAGAAALAVVALAALSIDRFREWSLEGRWRRIASVVLDVWAPDSRGYEFRGGTLRFLDARGKETFSLAGVPPVGGREDTTHQIAFDPSLRRIYVCERDDWRLAALDPSGKVLFRADHAVASLAVDPKTDHLWCLESGEMCRLLVLDTEGRIVAVHMIVGGDIAYDRHDDAFWVGGKKEVIKIDRRGKILARNAIPGFDWSLAVAADGRDGSARVMALDDLGARAVYRLDAGGGVSWKVPLDGLDPCCLACDRTGAAWIADRGKGISKITAEGLVLPAIQVPAIAISVSARDGAVWATTKDSVLKLGPAGDVLARFDFPRPSALSWIAAP